MPALLRMAPDMNSLVVLGSTAAWGYSVVATFLPSVLPAGTVNVYYEASAVIVTLILLGRFLEAKAKGRTSEAIKKLMGLQAKSARVERNGEIVEVPLDSVLVGDIVQVRPGDRVPVDGVVVAGSSFVDESMITGEPIPVTKGEGAEVVGGTINKTGSFTYPGHQGRRRHAAGPDHPHGRSRTRLQAADPGDGRQGHVVVRAGRYGSGLCHIPRLVLLRAGTGTDLRSRQRRGSADHRLPLRHGSGHANVDHGRHGPRCRTGCAVSQGRGASDLEECRSHCARQDRHADRRPSGTDGFRSGGRLFIMVEALSLVAAVESQSEHPIAAAIVAAAKAKGHAVPAVTELRSRSRTSARSGIVEGHDVAVGADRYMEKLGLDVSSFCGTAERLGIAGQVAALCRD